MQTTFVRNLICQGVWKWDKNVVVLLGNGRNGLVPFRRGKSKFRPSMENCMAVRSITTNTKDPIEDLPSGEYDIVIAGGGLVGTALACLLGKYSILESKRLYHRPLVE